MKIHPLLESSTRMALAAYLHDLGKFAERAAIEEAEQRVDSLHNTRKELHKQEYCPQYKGRYSHIHAAYTAIAMDVIEAHLPDIKKGDCFPFASWSSGSQIDDSLINAAARHHKPETFLQWVIATADRLASGFERSEFEQYNRAEEEYQASGSTQKTNHVTTRQYTLFEDIRLNDTKPAQYQYRYPLKPLSPSSIFPVKASQCQPANTEAGREEYRALWKQFIHALRRETGEDAIPQSHKQSLSLWFDHFDSLWMTFTHAIPSATAGRVDNKFIPIPADVSLYDHSRTTAALAAALWRWHVAHQQTDQQAVSALKLGADDTEQKFLLVQGDMAGIQEFIFASGGKSQKFAAKLLRGRSFMVSLLSECAALNVLEVLGLPPTSQVINAAGKFLIVAPNTPETIQALMNVRQKMNDWFLQYSQGRAGLALAWIGASSHDFKQDKTADTAPFAKLMERLFKLLEQQKLQRLALCDAATTTVFTDYLDQFALGECALDAHSPAKVMFKEGIYLSQLAYDQIRIGESLTKPEFNRILVTTEPLDNNASLKTDFLGYYISFTQSEAATGKFGPLAKNGVLKRAWDYALPDEAEKPLWSGYAKRFINGYVPLIEDIQGIESYLEGKYKNIDLNELDFEQRTGAIKPLDMVACEDRISDEPDQWRSISALHTLKGDVDNLGMIFQKGLAKPSFAKMAALSRQMNAFFAIWLPYLCKKDFKNAYTVFAGGDDFFLIGPWKSQIALAQQMQQDFARYVAHNPEIHFSAGMYLSKAGLPIRQLGQQAEEALDEAKTHLKGEKNSVTCFGQPVNWSHFKALISASDYMLELKAQYRLSNGFIYSLLNFASLAGSTKPENSIWRSRLAYQIQRNVGDKLAPKENETTTQFEQRRQQCVVSLLDKLVSDLNTHGEKYHIALHHYLYQYRD